ncbi:protein P21-like [Oryza brachyantha]|uniref:protein P21-like n=1 Tax=Oryza brachyantha TaxID=4533 RepID=UPI001ADACA89|nr:protein P21-like [Oryza brachyantha]
MDAPMEYLIIALVSSSLLLAAVVDAANITMVNRCSYTVWPGALPGGGARLEAGQSWSIDVAAGTPAARIWPRTGCSFDGSGRWRCVTGDCAGALSCSVSGEPPTTLAEYTLGRPGGGGDDFFDLSLVDGFNVPVSFQPTSGGAGCSKGRGPSCAVDITARCLPELQVPGGCASACGKFGGDAYCCRGQFERECPPTSYSIFFKQLCPDAYSYAKDDQTSTFTCPAGTDYRIEFCPPTSAVTTGEHEDEDVAGEIASA